MDDFSSVEDLKKPLLDSADLDKIEYLPNIGDGNENFSFFMGLAQRENLYNTSQFTPFTVELVKFPMVVDKIQKRSKKHVENGGYSQQRLDKDQSLVILKLTFNDVQQRAIAVYVQRTADARRKLKEDSIMVPLTCFDMTFSEHTCQFSVDLDSHYEYQGRQVYKLAKNQTEEVNRFELVVEVTFIDGTKSTLLTQSFLVRGKAHKNSPELPDNGINRPQKRARTGTDESHCSASSYSEDNSPSSDVGNLVGTLQDSFQETLQDSLGLDFFDFNPPTLAVSELRAGLAQIDDLIVGRIVQTQNGDIAYHFVLKEPNAHPCFKKGQCVGFFTDKLGRTVIDRLTPQNYDDAFLKGVITRDQYLECKKPTTDDVRTETICMFGVIPVQVVGTVHYMDRLVASPYHPGVAISERSLQDDAKLSDSTALSNGVGYALERLEPKDEDEVNLVASFVSIMVGLEGNMVDKRMKQLQFSFNSSLSSMKRTWRKQKRCRYAVYSASLLLLLLLGIFCWQMFVPGTAYRYWKCRKGSIKGSTASFSYIPTRNIYVSPVTVHGIEFLHNHLEEKMHFGTKPMEKEDVKYYLNLDRCAYGGLRETQDKVLGLKEVYGPNVFVINATCDGYVWYYYDRYEAWTPYNSARDVKCST